MFPTPSDMTGQREGTDVEVTETAVESTVANMAFYWKFAGTDDFENTLVGTHQHGVGLPRTEQTNGSLAFFSHNFPGPCGREWHTD